MCIGLPLVNAIGVKVFVGIAGAHRVFMLTKIKRYGHVERVAGALKLIYAYATFIFINVNASKGQFR